MPLFAAYITVRAPELLQLLPRLQNKMLEDLVDAYRASLGCALPTASILEEPTSQRSGRGAFFRAYLACATALPSGLDSACDLFSRSALVHEVACIMSPEA